MQVCPSATWGKSSPMTPLTCGAAAAVVMSVSSGSEHALVAASVMSLNSRVQKNSSIVLKAQLSEAVFIRTSKVQTCNILKISNLCSAVSRLSVFATVKARPRRLHLRT